MAQQYLRLRLISRTDRVEDARKEVIERAAAFDREGIQALRDSEWIDEQGNIRIDSYIGEVEFRLRVNWKCALNRAGSGASAIC